MANDLVIYQDDLGNEVRLSPGIVKRYLVNGNAEAVTDQEVMMYLKLCQVKKFNPFIKDCYLIKYPGNPATMVTSVDVFKRRMENHPMMDGFKLGVVVQREGEDEPIYREDSIVPTGTVLIGAWMEVKRKDWSQAVRCAVNISEYEQFKKDGTLTQNWRTKRATMITKCVIGCMGRLVFPSDFQGMYTAEEMAQKEDDLAKKEIEIPADHEEAVAEVQEVLEGEIISEETLPEVEQITSEGGKIIIEEEGCQEPTEAGSVSISPSKAENDDPSSPSPQPPSEDKEEKQKKMKALFATMNDYAKAIKANNPEVSGNLRNQIEEEVRDNMNLAYGKFSIKQLGCEELDELREWINAKKTALNGE